MSRVSRQQIHSYLSAFRLLRGRNPSPNELARYFGWPEIPARREYQGARGQTNQPGAERAIGAVVREKIERAPTFRPYLFPSL